MTVLKAEPWSHNGGKQWKRWDTSDPDLSLNCDVSEIRVWPTLLNWPNWAGIKGICGLDLTVLEGFWNQRHQPECKDPKFYSLKLLEFCTGREQRNNLCCFDLLGRKFRGLLSPHREGWMSKSAAAIQEINHDQEIYDGWALSPQLSWPGSDLLF